MEVLLARTAGFCFGVKRAVETVYEQIEKKSGKIYTYGPIIHNEQVVQDLEEKGVTVIGSREELERLDSGTVIIRSHGVPKEIYDIIERRDLSVREADPPDRGAGERGRETDPDHRKRGPSGGGRDHGLVPYPGKGGGNQGRSGEFVV